MPRNNAPLVPLIPPGWPVEWERRLNAFIRHQAEQPGATASTLQEARKVLVSFFIEGRLPGDYSKEEIEAFLLLNRDRRKKWRSIIEAFYAFAGQHPISPAGEQVEPPLVGPPEPRKPRQVRQQTKALTMIEIDDTWKRCMLDYLRSTYEKGKSTKTAQLHATVLRQFFSSSAGGGPPKHPTRYVRADIEDYVHRPTQGGRNAGGEPAVGTKIMRLHIIKLFYKWCENYTVEGPDGTPQRLLQTLPPTLGVPQLKRGQPRPKAMSLDEIRAFFQAIDASKSGPAIKARDRCMFLMYLITLRRREALVRLRWGDIAKVTITDKQGTRLVWQYSFVEKGRAGEVETLQLPEMCAQALLDYLRVSGRLETIKPEDYLFVAIGIGHAGAKTYAGVHEHLFSSTVAYNFKRYATIAGLPDTYSVHTFRHTGIRERLAAGEDMFSIMAISGHRSLDMFYLYSKRLTGATDPGASKIEKRLDFLGVK